MSKLKTLVYSGGEIHDWKGCGDAIQAALEAAGLFDITRVNNDLDCLVAPNLDPFDAIVFYHTVGSITEPQLKGLLKFVEGGKGYVGIHSAADSFRECSTYRYFVGGYFVTHPRYRQYQVSVVDSTHPITQGIEEFFVTDEQYITGYDPNNNILATALWRGKTVPVVWTRSQGKGRIAYVALGHNPESCGDETFKTLLIRGTVWAAAKPMEVNQEAAIWGMRVIEAARAVGAHTKVKPKDFLALLDRKGIPYAPNSTQKAVLRARRLAAGQPQPYYKAFPIPRLPEEAKGDLGL